MAAQCASGGAAVGQEDVPDELEMFGVIAADEDRRERVDGMCRGHGTGAPLTYCE